uniref:Uncharacterized protein n=1 Tax=Panagrolaimus davidi TaxID=227884 RepID=A0A914RCR4_9BILA
MLPAKLEDRCVLSDTLVYIFESQPLKQGSLNFLWETAEKCKIFEHSIVAVQILQSYIKAIPSEGRKNFSRLHEMLLRRNDIFQIEVLQLAVCCGTVISTAKAKLNELVAPKFRIPSTDNFFQVAIKQLTDHLDLPKSHRFFHRAKLTFQAVYALCESPDELCNDVISSVLCHKA